MRKLLLALFISVPVFAQNKTIIPVPKDPFNIPIYGGLGLPVFSEATTLTTSSYVSILTLPNTGHDINRSFRHIAVYNPDSARSVYICFGDASGCSTDMMKVPPGFALAFDHVLFGILYDQTVVYGRLDAVGSVTPEITVW